MTITTRELEYRDGDTVLTGVLAFDTGAGEPRPGILLVHGGAGLDAHARGQAERYAALGYTVLACDMFGPGVSGDRDRIRATLLGLRDDPDTLVRRASAGLAALDTAPEARTPYGAVGFCFGGLTVLTLARAGTDLAAVVSMHGSLATKKPAQPGAVRARILACHGALDPHVPLADVTAFAQEMDTAHADWELTMYGGAVHGFTHSDAVPGAMPGVEYHAEADRRSFTTARALFAEVL